MRPPVAPPPAAIALLARRLPAGERDVIIGDLTELHADRIDAGRRFNRLWFWMQTAGFLLGFAVAARHRLPPARLTGRSIMGRMTSSLRHAVRRLTYEWRYSAGVVLVLAVGIGPAAAMLSVVETVLLRPLAFDAPDRLAIARLHLGQIQDHPGLSLDEIVDFRNTTGLFRAVEAASRRTEVSLGPDDALVPLTAISITPGMLAMLGVDPVLGRHFTEADADGPAQGILLDHAAWQTYFGGEMDVVGRSIQMNGGSMEVLGVLPEGFRLTTGRGVPEPIDVYLPLFLRNSRAFWAFPTIVRLEDAVTLDQANAGLDALAASLTAEYPETYASADLRFALHPLQDDMTRESRPALRAALAGVLILLLIAVANVTALVVARLKTRERDLAIRSAIGAGRGVLVTEILSESLILSGGAALAGATVAVACVVAARNVMPHTVPRWDAIGIGWDLLIYASLFALVGLVAAGLIPVWKVSRAAPWRTLRGATPQGGRAEGAFPRLVLVGTQIALTVLLAFGAIQLVRSASRLSAVDVGYDARVLAFRVPFDNVTFPDHESRADVYLRVRDRLAQMPAVEAVGATSHLPLSGAVALDVFSADLTRDIEGDASVANYHAVTPGYLASIRVPFLAGRDITDAEYANAEPVVIIDETLAREAFGDADPVNRTLKLGWGIPDSRVVGVVRHARSIEIGRDVRPQVYAPFSTFGFGPLHFTARVTGDPLRMRSAVDAAVSDVGTGRAVSNYQVLTENVEAATSTQRSVASLVTLLATSAGLLSIVGLYTIIAYLLHQRRRATAIRAALGATSLQLVRLHMQTTMLVMAVALPVGLVLAGAAAPVFESLIYGVADRDVTSLWLAALVAAAAGVAGTLIPASRAARTDAAEVLRAEA